jgi:hypothetical protein
MPASCGRLRKLTAAPHPDGHKIGRPDGNEIPTVWDLDGENGRGSIQATEAYIANEAVLD